MNWYVYILKCADETLYTGVTTDITRRIREHNGEMRGGAKYTQGRRPVILVHQEKYESQSHACSREVYIKRLPKSKKKLLFDSKKQ